MHPYKLFAAALAIAAVAGAAKDAGAQQFLARLSGFSEVGDLNNETGAILTDATATLRLFLDPRAHTAAYRLSYSSGFTSTVTQAHIHFGKNHVPGGILVFLCTNLGNGPAGTPACPAAPATVTGTLTAANILAIPGENVAAGNFGALENALFFNTAYINIHTAQFPLGEVRGQIYPVGTQP
ncbi:MAG TPA: CHRD domain-containing protein [Stellaceae bacterium]|nr:CHRD domain-containing protein [Stellaceae bacterium]